MCKILLPRLQITSHGGTTWQWPPNWAWPALAPWPPAHIRWPTPAQRSVSAVEQEEGSGRRSDADKMEVGGCRSSGHGGECRCNLMMRTLLRVESDFSERRCRAEWKKHENEHKRKMWRRLECRRPRQHEHPVDWMPECKHLWKFKMKLDEEKIYLKRF